MCIVSAATRTAPYVQLAVSRDRAGASGFCRLKTLRCITAVCISLGNLINFMCTLHAITHRKCSKGPYLIFLFSFFIKCQWVMPDVSLTGEDVNPNAARVLAQTRRKAPVWPSAKRSCFSFSNCSLMCQKKEEKKRKERKKNRFMLYRGSDALVFFFFFLGV